MRQSSRWICSQSTRRGLTPGQALASTDRNHFKSTPSNLGVLFFCFSLWEDLLSLFALRWALWSVCQGSQYWNLNQKNSKYLHSRAQMLQKKTPTSGFDGQAKSSFCLPTAACRPAQVILNLRVETFSEMSQRTSWKCLNHIWFHSTTWIYFPAFIFNVTFS